MAYIAQKVAGGFAIALLTERGDAYLWSDVVYATEEEVRGRLAKMRCNT